MTSCFLVYTEDEQKPELITQDLAEALELFCHAVFHAEAASLHWSL